MDFTLTFFYGLFIILHGCGILYNIYAISLSEVLTLHKIQVFLLLISLMPVLATDVIIVSCSSGSSLERFDGLINSFDIFAILSYHVFFTNFTLGKLGQITKGFGSSFYPKFISALVVKAFCQPVIGLVGLSLINLSSLNYTSFFICCYHAVGLMTLSVFLVTLQRRLDKANVFNYRRVTPTKLDIEEAASKPSTPTGVDRGLQHINKYMKSLLTKTVVNTILSAILLGVFHNGSASSGYYISLSWKFTMGLSGILATKSTVDFHQARMAFSSKV